MVRSLRSFVRSVYLPYTIIVETNITYQNDHKYHKITRPIELNETTRILNFTNLGVYNFTTKSSLKYKSEGSGVFFLLHHFTQLWGASRNKVKLVLIHPHYLWRYF